MRARRRTVLAAVALAASFASLADERNAELALRLGLAGVAMKRADAALEESIAAGSRSDGALVLAAAAREKALPPADAAAWLRTFADRPAAAEWMLARALCASGKPEEAAQTLAALQGRLGENDPLLPLVIADRAHALALCGREADAALALSSAASESAVSAFSMAAGILAGETPGSGAQHSLAAVAYAAAAALQASRAFPGPPGGVPEIPPEALENARTAAALAGDDSAVFADCGPVLLAIEAAAGNGAEALAAARRLVAAAPVPSVAAALRSAASALIAAGDPASALALADLHAASFAELQAEGEVQKLRAMALQALQRTGEAIAAWDAAAAAAAAAARPQDSAAAKLEGARLALAAGDTADAARRLSGIDRTALSPAAEGRLYMLKAEMEESAGGAGNAESFERVAAVADSPDAATAAARASLAAAIDAGRAGDAGKAVEKLREAAFGRNGGSAAERALALLPAACHAAGLDEEALVHYDDFTNRYAASRFMPDVKFWRASMEFDGGEWLRASDLLLSFAADCPESPKTPYAEYLAAVALVRSGRESQAAAVLDGVVSKWPDCAIVPDALLLEAESLASIMRFDAAAAVFDRASAANASRPQIALRAALRRADCLFATSGDFPAGRDESMAIYRRIASDAAAAQSAGLVAECRWKIGRALEKAGKTEDALDEWFGGCIAPFERSADPAAAPWYSRAVFSSAAILAASGRREAAAALLSHLASSPGVPGGEEAARRLEAL